MVNIYLIWSLRTLEISLSRKKYNLVQYVKTGLDFYSMVDI